MTAGVLLSGLAAGPADAVGPGRYSAPEWFPLRRDVSGADIKIGCTYLSRGSQGGYDCAGSHSFWALDLLASSGTNIYPAGAGYARDVTGQGAYSGYGNVVVVDHGNNVESLYAHMSQVLVSPGGAWVDLNTVIGKVGSSGRATVAHLHFETTSAGRFGAGSRDPGALKACHGSQLITYPGAWGLFTWEAIPWGTQRGYSDGTGCVAAPATRTSTKLKGDPARRRPLGLLGLSGTRITYSTHLSTTGDISAVVGGTIRITIAGRQACTAVTDGAGNAMCSVTYPLFGEPARSSSYMATFAGDSSHMPSNTLGSTL